MKTKESAIAKYQKMINKAIENQNFESFEEEDLEGFENVEDENENENENENEDLENIVGTPAQRHMQAKRLTQQRFSNFGRPKIVRTKPRNLIHASGNPDPNSIAAQIDIKIERLSNEIGVALPLMIFNPINGSASFKGILPLPSVIASISSSYDLDGNLFIYFTDNTAPTPNIETIKISCLNVPYQVLMEGLKNAEFNLTKMRFTADPVNYPSYFSQVLATVRRSLFGKISDSDSIPFASQKSPSNFAQNIIDVDLDLHMQKDKGLIYSMPPLVGSILISFFMKDLYIY